MGCICTNKIDIAAFLFQCDVDDSTGELNDVKKVRSKLGGYNDSQSCIFSL